MANFDTFVSAAREFSDWCVSPAGTETEEARRALSHLVRLYTLALELQFPDEMDCDRNGERADDATWKLVYRRAAALPFNYYSDVFDPQTVPSEEPEVGDLADDIADIYRDLSEGLDLSDAGLPSEAEWSFRHSFWTHWGRHASSAIKALHCWLEDTGSW